MTAIDRYGNEYRIGDIVQMKPTSDYLVKYSSVIGKDMEIVDMEPCENCESGHMLTLKIVGLKNMTKKYDTNWIQKI